MRLKGVNVFMATEEQHITILEACGWAHLNHKWWFSPDETKSGRPYSIKELPCNLDLMHEAETFLIKRERATNDGCWSKYLKLLDEICFLVEYDPRHATVDHRVEAFLKTVNRWKD